MHLPQRQVHKSITTARIVKACQRDDYSGYCLACGKRNNCCEPDAEEYECQKCHIHAVMGAETILCTYNLP